MTKEEKLLPELLKKHDVLTVELITATTFIRGEIERLQQELRDITSSEKYSELKTLESDIKQLVLKEMKTAQSACFQFIYKKGASRWDGKKLMEFSSTHPGILEYKKTGKPSVSVKKVSK